MLLAFPVIAQECPPGDVELTNQEQVEQFKTDYPNCTKIDGTITIKGKTNINFSVIDLSPLLGLEEVGGDLIVSSTHVNSVVGLDSLQRVGGDLVLNFNRKLHSITALISLTEIEGDFKFDGSPDLESLSGLESLQSVGKSLKLDFLGITTLQGLDALTEIGESLFIGCRELRTLAGLDNLETLGGGIYIVGTPLNDITALGKLKTIPWTVTFKGTRLRNFRGLDSIKILHQMEVIWNDSLESFKGLENIASIKNMLSIDGNNELSHLHGLSSLTSVKQLNIVNNDALIDLTDLQINQITEGLVIEDNDALTHLGGLENLSAINTVSIQNNSSLQDLEGLTNLTQAGNINISDNPELDFCNIEMNCIALEQGGNIIIEKNGQFCRDLVVVSCTCETPDGTDCITCPEGSQSFRSQMDVEEFITQYPQCRYIDGDLTISGPVNNLDGLTILDSIDGSLSITNTEVITLDGLDNLQSIDGNLIIANNDTLKGITGLNALISVKDVSIHSNHNLSLISGFNSLQAIEFLEIARDDSLRHITGFNALTETRSLFLDSNEVLNDLSGFASIQCTGQLVIKDNANLETLNGLDALTEIGSERYKDEQWLYNEIRQNPKLRSMEGLTSLERVEGTFLIAWNDRLESLEGLNNLNYAGGLVIIENPGLTSLAGLVSLDTVHNREYPWWIEYDRWGMFVENNPELTEATLNSLDHVEGELHISLNPNLKSIEFNELSSIGGGLHINSNPEMIDISFNDLQKIGGGLFVARNFEIENLGGFSSLEEVGQTTVFFHPDDFWSINHSINIEWNEKLTNIDGLSGLNHALTGELHIRRNSSLESISGLRNITDFSRIFIAGNQSLTNCDYDNIIEEILSMSEQAFHSTTYSEIARNGTCCDSYQIILDRCILGLNDQLIVLPNPVSGYLQIEGVIEDEVDIYTLAGRRVFHSVGKDQYDLSSVQDGLYLLSIRKGNQITKRKMIIRQ